MSTRGRRWLEVRVRSPWAGDRAPLLADGLVSLGARGVEERDGWYISYFPEPDDVDVFVREAQLSLTSETGLDSLLLEHGWQEHEEWAETWKRGLSERRITDRIVVHPSWIEPNDVRDGDAVVVLDPGMAFGTAEHGTTRGCLRLLDRVVRPGERYLDIGSGSGILAIAAVQLGASEVVAIEGDSLACEALAENLERNAVAERVRLVEGWATAESIATYGVVDGVIANIESGLLLPLFEGVRQVVRPEGWLIVSGILDDEWAQVKTALVESGFRFLAIDEDGAWRSGLFERLSDTAASVTP
jgi:ribosomal protein L11 methyltransferase